MLVPVWGLSLSECSRVGLVGVEWFGTMFGFVAASFPGQVVGAGDACPGAPLAGDLVVALSFPLAATVAGSSDDLAGPGRRRGWGGGR